MTANINIVYNKNTLPSFKLVAAPHKLGDALTAYAPEAGISPEAEYVVNVLTYDHDLDTNTPLIARGVAGNTADNATELAEFGKKRHEETLELEVFIPHGLIQN